MIKIIDMAFYDKSIEFKDGKSYIIKYIKKNCKRIMLYIIKRLNNFILTLI